MEPLAPQSKEKVLVVNFISDMGGCGYLRTIWPNEMLNAYYGSRRKYEGFYTSRFLVDSNILKEAKAIHLQRQITNNQIEYIRWMRTYLNKINPNAKMIYDMDDKIDCIPKYNLAWQFFDNPNFVHNLKEIANVIDVFSVSTQPLADWISSFGCKCKVEVIPNLLPKYIYKPNPIIKTNNFKPRIVWAGSSTHYDDKLKGDFEPIYDLIINTCDEFEWIFMGVTKLPLWLESLNKKIKLIKWTPMTGFTSMMKSVSADIGLAPLIDIPFNHAKSNIKLLDYWACDMVAIASDVTPYKESELFLTGDWQNDRMQIWDAFKNKDKYLEKQNEKLNKYFLEDNLNIYMKLYGLT